MSGARWVVFAYHTFGARALQGLLARGENIAAVVTHADDPAEGDWFESVAAVARSAGISVLAPPSPGLAEVAASLGPLEADSAAPGTSNEPWPAAVAPHGPVYVCLDAAIQEQAR